jgi:hypothetical protein
MAKMIKYLDGACQVNTASIVSEAVEISADIDQPEDFPIVSGIPWNNEIGGSTGTSTNFNSLLYASHTSCQCRIADQRDQSDLASQEEATGIDQRHL